ncbi:MAG: dUTP diphosphatase [Bacilli bacterium]
MDNITESFTSGYCQVINMLPVKIKRLYDNAKIPTRGSAAAAGYDLYAYLSEDNIIIPAHSTVLIGTGISMALPDGTFLGLYPRSGLASKRGLRPANCVGVVDSDYRGEIKVALHNDTNEEKMIENGERVAQGILQSYLPMNFEITNNLDETERGLGGFGSTGSK